ncbi:MAG TPA: phage major capsid protein [Ignavibacteriales bacterium]|nr:phage major capsid protein [Ignavibacteriales bacterium]
MPDLVTQEEVGKLFKTVEDIKASLSAIPNDGIKKSELEKVINEFSTKFAALEESKKVVAPNFGNEAGQLGFMQFMKMIAYGQKTAISEATEGATVVPTAFSKQILETALNSSVVAGDCTPVPMATNKTDVPAQSTDVTVAWVAESGGITPQAPITTKITPTLGSISAIIVYTQEQLQDQQIDLTSFYQKRVGLKAGQTIDAMILEGDYTGSGDLANGIKKASGVNSTTFTKPITDENIIDLQNSQEIEAYHNNAKWYFNRKCLGILMKLKDDNGQPLFGSLVNGVPTMLLGKPFKLTDQVSGSGTSTSKTSIYYGDMSNAWLLSHSLYPNMTVEETNSMLSPNPTPTQNTFLQRQKAFRYDLRKGYIIAIPAAFVRGLSVYK